MWEFYIYEKSLNKITNHNIDPRDLISCFAGVVSVDKLSLDFVRHSTMFFVFHREFSFSLSKLSKIYSTSLRNVHNNDDGDDDDGST